MDRRLNQVDPAIEEAAKRGKTNSALSAIEAQRKAVPASWMSETAKPALWPPSRPSARRWPPKAAGSRPRPIRYVAEVFGADADRRRATRWLIGLPFLTCDPLAIALTSSAHSRSSTI